MDRVSIIPFEKLNHDFIEGEDIPKGKDEYYLREMQIRKAVKIKNGWRHLTAKEIVTLVKNNNISDNWDNFLVCNPFDPSLIYGNTFHGLVRIGAVTHNVLQYHDLRLPIGITNCNIVNCDIGNNVALHEVHYLANYIIGDQCMLFNIQEMTTTNHAKFGNGILKKREEEDVRVRIELMNESGARSILPFDGIITADAYMWAKYIDDNTLQERLQSITQNTFDERRGFYGTIGESCVIKNSLIIKDAKIGAHCYLKGVSKIKNITINSSEKEPSQIGEGCILVNGIVGFGCHIFYSVTAIRFVIGNNSNLKYGARLINSFMGDNSTISCCEVLNNLIFPSHEQHHNNSFLISSIVMGQSNIAAGATLGSNHNSRTADGEIQAGRGFWPGLCTSVKHNSRFASYTLLAKADYPAELDIQLPFSLVSNNSRSNELEVMPAYWWMYNMFALARNTDKYRKRDKRLTKVQHIEFDTYAPDTMEEVILGRKLLEIFTAKAWCRTHQCEIDPNDTAKLRETGKKLLNGNPEEVRKLEVFGDRMEKSGRNCRILKPYEAYHAYGDMLVYYGVTNVLRYIEEHQITRFKDLAKELGKHHRRQKVWINMGGQVMMEKDLDRIRADINAGVLNSWKEIHKRYDEIWKRYPTDKQSHAYLSLCYLLETDNFTEAQWKEMIRKTMRIQQYICDQVYASRNKDYTNPFRHSTTRNEAEFLSLYGQIDDIGFVRQTKEETEEVVKRLEKLV
ncbi:MAG: DUF4954 family protein [Bacteroidales bacterium]|nr:DUF4954 family protein [Bacteroidales bacterium]